jgi:hypothetical protein
VARFGNKQAPPVIEPQILDWSPLTRLAFRFSFVYLGLYILATQISGSLFLVPGVSYRGLGLLWPMREITLWVARAILGIEDVLVYTGNNGETLFFWVQTFWLLVLAVAAVSAWSVLDRRRGNDATLHKWFRLFVRFALAATMFEYGMTKIIPIQFASPSLNILVTPIGNASLETILWTSIGAAPAYQIFIGCAEMLGGILLLVPRTTLLGAIVCLAATTHVFVLNMTYDIGLKQISFHLILLALFLLAPDFGRLADFFVRRRVTAVSEEPDLFPTPGANRIALAAQILCGVYLIGMYTYVNWSYWYVGGGGRPKSALYGIWNVEQLAVDGEVRSPVLNDYDRRWRRVIFDAPDTVVFQRLDDSFARYGVSIDVRNKRLALTKGNSRSWKSHFIIQDSDQDQLTLEGEMDGHKIQMQLQRVDFDTLRLLNSGFRWVRPPEP